MNLLKLFKNGLIVLATFLLIHPIVSQTTKKVLFIGNSQTFVNDVPNLVKQMASSVGDILDYEDSTFGSYSLDQHANNTQTMDKIKKGGWEYVVIQGSSGTPSLSEDYVAANVYPNYRRINDSIKKYNPCAKTVIYQTWGYKNGFPSQCASWPAVCTYEGMDDLLQTRFKTISEDIHAAISPVGKVWRRFRELQPTTNLYHADQYHASLHGSYLSAMTFYSLLFEKSPENINYNPGVLPSRIIVMKSIVKELVSDNLSDWFVKEADFNHDLVSNTQVNFTSKEKYATSYAWDFGDGNSSTDKNPLHTYASGGIYNVKLTISYCGSSYDLTQSVNTEVASTDNFELKTVYKFQNPIKGVLKLYSKEEVLKIKLFNLKGEKVLSSSSIEEIDVSHLSKGMYLLKIETPKKENATYKVIIE